MITLPPESAESLYRRRQDEVRAEIHRVRSARIPAPERNRHVRRLVSAVRELQRARDNPEIFAWRYYTAQMSWLRISGVVTCVIVGVLVIPQSFRRSHEWSVASVLLMITVVGAIWGAISGSWPLQEGLDRRRKLRGALRLAERTQSGKRRPRAEAFDAPFVGPPAADLLVIVAFAIGVLMSEMGSRLESAFVVLLSMVVFAVALARRLKLRLKLPFVNERAKSILFPTVAASILLIMLSRWAGSAVLGRVGLVGIGLTLFYMASVGLAEEAFMARSDIIRLDERPVYYWLHLSLTLITAFLASGLALLLDIPSDR